MNVPVDQMSSASSAYLARAALRSIAELRIPPTPENFERLYYRAAGVPIPDRPKPMDAGLVQRLDEVVAKASATAEHLADDLGQKNGEMAASLDRLVVEDEPADTVEILREVAASARDIQMTAKASYAELLDTRRALAEIKAELSEGRKLLGQDPLTGTENRRAMSMILDREMARSKRNKEPLTVVMVDIDHFKQINDTYGHAAGDAALVHMTQVAKHLLRGNDAFVRYGGEEFLMVLPGTGLQSGAFTTERLLGTLARQPVVHEGMTIPMTFSAGVATLNITDTERTLLARADDGMYQAKKAGRNRVVITS